MNARPRVLGALCAALFGAGCSEQSVTVELRSLSASGDVSYVCRDADGNGVALSECSAGGLYSGRNDLYALVTQTSSGEVAVINVPYDMDNRDDDEGVVDVDPSSPGYGFLRVGAQPVDIVSMPGGQATFVASAEPGRTGIYALPTSCVDTPRAEEPPRDLTTWPACRLPAARGGLALVKGACAPLPAAEPAQACPHGITETAADGGCTKLVISQPDSGSLLVLDARTLLEQPQGSFVDCAELGKTTSEEAADDTADIPLSVSLPAVPIQPKLPADLDTGCPPIPLPVPAPGPVAVARPARIESSEGTLYVADQRAPVIHVLEMDSSGELREAPPLLPSSYWAPQRSVTVSRLAVSPLTPSGKRWLYAVDELDWPTASLMAFDVSPGSTERTPHLRERSTKVPDQPPDRITFPSALRDITFVMRDRPEFDDTGVALLGELCDPDPATPSNSPGALYRPNVDRDTGARPYKLRGLFGMAMLSDGGLSVIDVEDFDAPCRRPPDPVDPNADLCDEGTGPASAETVTGEVSCRMVEPHTPRAARLAINDFSSASAPSLRSLPTLDLPSEARQEDVSTRPKLLTVDTLSEVWVGSTFYSLDSSKGPTLNLDPAAATDNAVGLPYADIRAYRGFEQLSLEFEGPISTRYQTGFFQRSDDGGLVLNDANAVYCDAGVSDRELMAELAERKFARTAADAAEFGETFADHIVITADFPLEDDRYWPHRTEVIPGDPSSELTCTRDSCEAYFGDLPDTFDATELNETRQFEILDAEQQRLVLDERGYSARRRVASDVALLDEQRNRHLAMAECCFPEGSSYEVHASNHWALRSSIWGFRHDVVPRTETENGRTVIECRHDCDPRKEGFQTRVFEIATEECTPRVDGTCPLNACFTDTRRAVRSGKSDMAGPRDDAWACVHDTPTARFALYRGTLASYPGMRFTWQVANGYVPMTFDLGSLSQFVSPQAVVNLPDLDRITIVDATSLGLTMLSLDGLRPLIPTLN